MAAGRDGNASEGLQDDPSRGLVRSHAENERRFARIVIGFFQRGIRDEELLFAESLGVARQQFSAVKIVQPQIV